MRDSGFAVFVSDLRWNPVRIGLHGIEEQAHCRCSSGATLLDRPQRWAGSIIEPEVEHLPAESHEGPPQWRKDPAPRSHYWKQGFDARI